MTIRFFTLIFTTLLFSFLILCSCEKEKGAGPQESISSSDTCTKVFDTLSLVVGNYNNMNVFTFNRILDLTESENDTDSLVFWINLNNETRAQLLVLKDSIASATPSGWQRLSGFFYRTSDANFSFGKRFGVRYAFQEGDTLNLENLTTLGYQPDCFYDVTRLIYKNLRTGIDYSVDGTQIPFWQYNDGQPFDRFGTGFLCFRFLEGDQIKYGWIKLNLESNLKLTVNEVAYMK